MSPTPEKADPDICPSTSAFPGEPTYRCAVAGWHPHTLHDDGEHHRWFDAIPDLPIFAWQADFLEQMLGDGTMPPKYIPTGHENTDRALREQAEANAQPLGELRMSELMRQNEAAVREIAAQTLVPPISIPRESPFEATVADLTAELQRLDHDIADLRMEPTTFPLSEATLRERRERVRQAREKRVKLEEWYGAFVPRYAYGTIAPRPVSFVEALAAAEAPRVAKFEETRAGFESAFRPVMKEAAEMAKKKKLETMDLPKVEYATPPGSLVWHPSNPEAAKVDHVMTRDGGQVFGIARVSKEPIPDGTTIRTQKTEDILLDSYTGRPTEAERRDSWDHFASERDELADSLSDETLADVLAKAMGTGEVRTTSSTGGEKGMKPARFDLIPVMPLTKLAELYGAGAAKYESNQWRQGYEISKSYAALMRHVTAFWGGEDNDPELGTPHLASVMWHAMAMMQFLQDFPQHDDRYKKEA